MRHGTVTLQRLVPLKNVHRVVAAVRDFLRRQELRRTGVVAVSGGPDSVALLRALAASRPERLVIAHLNHRLRGAESDADEAFVRQLCESLGLDFASTQIDIVATAPDENREAAARRLRYDWLAEVAVREGLPWIATGHTANDQAETVLHRLLRGTGLRGLRGIAVRRPLNSSVELVRPILQVARTDVLDYLASLGQSCREDATNTDLRLTRNRIRHELLPHLAERYNPAVVEGLTRVSEHAQEMYAELEESARRLLTAVELPRAGTWVILDREQLAHAPRHRLREALRLLFEREGWPNGSMSFDHWDRLASVARGEVTAVELPEGIRAQSRGRVVQLGRLS